MATFGIPFTVHKSGWKPSASQLSTKAAQQCCSCSEERPREDAEEWHCTELLFRLQGLASPLQLHAAHARGHCLIPLSWCVPDAARAHFALPQRLFFLTPTSLTPALYSPQTDRATQKIAALLDSKPSASGVRLGITNDWGSHTGFSYTLDFVDGMGGDESDERILLHNSATLFVDRKALWAGQGGLLGATLDIDDDFRVIVEPKE